MSCALIFYSAIALLNLFGVFSQPFGNLLFPYSLNDMCIDGHNNLCDYVTRVYYYYIFNLGTFQFVK